MTYTYEKRYELRIDPAGLPRRSPRGTALSEFAYANPPSTVASSSTLVTGAGPGGAVRSASVAPGAGQQVEIVPGAGQLRAAILEGRGTLLHRMAV